LLQYVRSARRSKGSTGQTLLQALEMRLDNILYRAGLAPTIPAARQLVNHGHVRVNQRIVDIPSYRCRLRDKIQWRQHAQPLSRPTTRQQLRTTAKVPPHLYVKGQTVAVQKLVDRRAIGLKVNELLIVEYYSRQA